MALSNDKKKKSENSNRDYTGRRNLLGQSKNKTTKVTTTRDDAKGKTVVRKDTTKTRSISPNKTMVVKRGNPFKRIDHLGFGGLGFRQDGNVKTIRTNRVDNFLKRKAKKGWSASDKKDLVTKNKIQVTTTKDAFAGKSKKAMESELNKKGIIYDAPKTNSYTSKSKSRGLLNKVRLYKASQTPRAIGEGIFAAIGGLKVKDKVGGGKK